MSIVEPRHVLHVEDSDEDAALVLHLLERYPLRISRARTYGEMMEHNITTDVVLLDLRIPGSDDPIRLVADAVRRFRNAGIILLTGIADREGEELSVRAMAAGAQIRMIKNTFDSRRLWLAVREAYQQRQHMLRTLEESRADMRVQPEELQASVGAVIDSRISQLEARMKRRLKQLGADDTQPHDVVPSDVNHRMVRDVLQWGKRHIKAIQWIMAVLGAAYLAAGDYVTGLRNAVLDTQERVERIERKIDGAR